MVCDSGAGVEDGLYARRTEYFEVFLASSCYFYSA